MPASVVNATERLERVLAEKLDLLYRNNAAVATNFAVACIVTALLWESFPHSVLASWLIAVAAVCAARILVQRHFLKTPLAERCSACVAWRFAVGTGASGLLWGLLCLGLPLWGTRFDYVIMAVTAAGMTAGAVTTIAIYYPAYISYLAGFTLPLVAVCTAQADRNIVGIGAMIVIYICAISTTAYYTNRFINRTMELRVDNEMLKASLDSTRVERDAARTEKWSALTQLSHELRTPLNAILGFSEAMNNEIFGSLGHRRYKEYVGHVLDSGRQLLTLTDELLLLSQGEAGTLVVNDATLEVAAMLRAAVEVQADAAAKAGLKLGCAAEPHLPLLRADRNKLRQILFNLIDNAIKFTPPGGVVSVTAGLVDGAIAIAVHDTGIGMRADLIPQALKPFGRLAAPLSDNTAGAGLGLPICLRLAEMHDAALDIQSDVGQGTVCTIAFPPQRSVASAQTAAA